ncbi:hypothetical protein K2173_023033 [Erythroxylum novogranatense]|uniref:C3H1-type domain-containing protein n=1 Tax=Erythroxylum novogranatense TaxID=1862640 RepID=A0AAV8T9C3_9ROSI|nr:hypothetical protein K2173_023033 [Erythroxylum novogranatense]
MDPRPPYLHQHARYYQPRPPAPPPPHHPFPESPNFFVPQHRPNPIPSPTLLPQPSPPPHPFGHHHHRPPHLRYNSDAVNLDYRLRPRPEFSNPPRSPGILHPQSFTDEFPRRVPELVRHNRSNCREMSPRVSADGWTYPPVDLEPQSYRLQLDHQPLSPMGKIRREMDGNSRITEERSFRVEDCHRRGQFGWSADRPSRDFRTSNDFDHGSTSRDFGSSSGTYENRHGLPYHHDEVIENQRRLHDIEAMRDAREFLINEIDDCNANRGRREHYRNEGLEMLNSKGSREGSHDFNRTPRKQLPKKSALLRIQKPNHWNREGERVHYSGYIDDTKSNSFRGKDQNLHLNQMMVEEVREGSPVQLDVSFKSNSLVAKAIVTPPNSGRIPSTNLTHRKSKMREVLTLTKDFSSSSFANSNDSGEKLDSLTGVPNDVPSSDKVLKQSKEKITSCRRKCNGKISHSGSGVANAFLAKGRVVGSSEGPVSDKGGNNTSGALPSLIVAGKRKTVKRVMKKVANPSLSSSNLQPAKRSRESVKEASLAKGLPDPLEPEDGTVTVSIDAKASQHCSNGVAAKCRDLKEEAFVEHTVSGKVVPESSRLGELKSKRKKVESTPLPHSAIGEETRLLENLGSINSSADLHMKRDTFLHEDNPAKESPEVLLSIEENATSGLVNSEETKSCNTAVGLGSELFESKEKTVCDIEGKSDVHKQTCTGLTSSLVENDIVDRCVNISVPIGRGEISNPSRPDTAEIQHHASFAGCFEEKVDSVVGCNTSCTNSNNHKFSRNENVDTISEKQSPSESLSVKSMTVGAMISLCGNEEDISDVQKNSQKLELSRSEVSDGHAGPQNIVSSVNSVDTTLRLSCKDPIPIERIISGDTFVDVGFHHRKENGVDGMHQISISESGISISSSVNIGSDEPSARMKKKRKISASQLEFTSPIASDDNRQTSIAPLPTSCFKVPFSSVGAQEQPEEENTASCMDSTSIMYLTENLPDNTSSGKYLDALALVTNPFRGVPSYPLVDLTDPNVPSSLPSDLKGEQITNASPIMSYCSHQSGFMDIESINRENMDTNAAEEQALVENGATHCKISLELPNRELDERLPSTGSTDAENKSYVGEKTDLYFTLNNLPKTLSNVASLENLSDVPSTLIDQKPSERITDGDILPIEELEIEGGIKLARPGSCSQNANLSSGSDHMVESGLSLFKKRGPLQSHTFNSSSAQYTSSGELYGMKNELSHAASRVYPGRSSFYTSGSKVVSSSAQSRKPRTWRRIDTNAASASSGNKSFLNNVSSLSQLPTRISKSPTTSYIRKGNSLVRKPNSVASQSQNFHGSNSVQKLSSLGTNEVKKIFGSDIRTDPITGKSGGANALFERPKTPPLPNISKIPSRTTNCVGDIVSSLLPEPLHNVSPQTTSERIKSAKTNDASKSSEVVLNYPETGIEIVQVDNLESKSELVDGITTSSNVNNTRLVERKLNHLVATSSACVPPMHSAYDNTTLTSDGYYKRRENQLIRTSAENHVIQKINMADNPNADGQSALNVGSSRSFSRRTSRKVGLKSRKHSKFSLVWTLHGAETSKSEGNLLYRQKPLFPWKRRTHWKSFVPSSALGSTYGPLCSMGKLLLLRNRDTVYTRSKHGFSLRKSKVLSVGGSSLKWSKSIERRSKKANEEATRAVAEAEKKKRELGNAATVVTGTKHKNGSSRERIFRIGFVRYRMDSSRRTLQRIPSDDESPLTAAGQKEKDGKRTYVPSRLVIGKNEYVRIGNGNQLIRNPKKRIRILASEKVRWSLHTARSRLARKRKYCQFFTRFGKCNKDDGKCPYIHDSSKIAVCTKFLNGLCSNNDCKLTHKVIPERMPDCSYFLQGLCTNRSCPYRHVHVNPNASTCEGFLRGYCADGNECRKKHSYVCPIYEARGSCPQGSKCKLHHPKKRSKGKKRKQLQQKSNSQGRYFCTININGSEPGIVVSERHPHLGNGSSTDYISLDASDVDLEENDDTTEGQTTFSEKNVTDSVLDLDLLTKPIRIMNI